MPTFSLVIGVIALINQHRNYKVKLFTKVYNVRRHKLVLKHL